MATLPERYGYPDVPDAVWDAIDRASDERAAEAPPLTARQIARLSRLTQPKRKTRSRRKSAA